MNKKDNMIKIEDYLRQHGVEFILHEHPAVFTCEEADLHCGHIPGLPSKNLFLKDKKGRRYFLLILPASKRADLKKISLLVGEPKLTFASPRELMEKLQLEPGAVSPFGLINDQEKMVEVYLDEDVRDAEATSFHPNRNTASLELTKEMFQRYLKLVGHQVQVVSF
jgi:Ala-tRNA(Pro) deacylase